MTPELPPYPVMAEPATPEPGSSSTVHLDIPGASDRRSSVHIGRGLLGDAARFESPCEGARRALIVRDTGVSDAHAQQLARTLEYTGLQVATHCVTPSEREKSLHTLEGILGSALQAGLERRDVLVALGGGIVGDLTGYAAASYLRGVRVIQCPTTLLAMVDASVGGKTGVNLSTPDGSLWKNMAGAFWQPATVVIDVDTLNTLPDRERRSGMAECLKHGLLSAGFHDPNLFPWTYERSATTLWNRPTADQDDLTALVVRNVRVKASVVQSDERETDASGGRALLNLGHTFGHAIETLPNLSPTDNPEDAPLHHGEAVALGTIAAFHASAHAGLCDSGLIEQVQHAYEAAQLPIRIAGLPASTVVMERMVRDKKSTGGSIRLVLPIGDSLGRVRLVSDVEPACIEAGINAIRA